MLIESHCNWLCDILVLSGDNAKFGCCDYFSQETFYLAVHFKVVVLLLRIHCFLLHPLFVGILCSVIC